MFSTRAPSSERFRSLPTLPLARHRIPELLPTDRIHQPSLLASRHDNTKLVPICRNIVIALVAETDHHGPDQIADAETLFDLDLVLLCCAYVFAPYLSLEGFATDCVADDENLTCCEACAETCDAREHYAVDFGEDGCATPTACAEYTWV
jgi:hypothetical protein